MMKKILAFALVVCLCVPALFSCASIKTKKTVDNLADKYSVSQPTKVSATTKQTVNELELNSSYEIVTGYVDNAPAFVYTSTVESLRSVDEGGENEEIKQLIKVESKKIEGIEGKGTRVNGGTWDEEANLWSIGRGRMALNLNHKLLKDISYENNTFKCTIPYENVADVLGSSYAADVASDVILVIVDDGAVVTSVELFYNLTANADVHITTSSMHVKVVYTYDIEKINID